VTIIFRLLEEDVEGGGEERRERHVTVGCLLVEVPVRQCACMRIHIYVSVCSCI
jgi:hypothetical protein